MGMALAEIRTKGWDALMKELGPAGATKFILIYEPGMGNYTEERKKIFKDIKIEDILQEIKLPD